MSSKFYLLLIPLLITQLYCFGDPISKALKALKKGKHQQVESVLEKSLQKNSINPGARYVWSLLFYDSTYNHSNLDSAHLFIEQALLDEQQPDSLDGLLLEKSDLTIDHLLAHKSAVDSSAYAIAVDSNTVQSFQLFIDEYQNAPQLANAISRRNLIAFEIASAEHSFKSYKKFLDQYPDSYQVPEARKRYDILVFKSKTSDGKLEQYLKFLEEHPHTPYRNQAEWQIFQLQTLDDRPESYNKFKNDFPNSKYVPVADNILYHLDKEAFMKDHEVSDSLARINKLESTSLIPIFENDQYGFMDHYGVYQIPASFDSIPENYLCQLLTTDVFQAYVNKRLVAMGRNQKILWDRPFDGIKDMGRGLLELNIGNKYGVLHKSGWLILKVEYDQIKLLGDSFIAINKDGKWGIASMTGRLIVPMVHQRIQSEGAFIVLKKDQWAISTKKYIIKSFKADEEFSYQYQDWELINHDNLMVFTDDKEGILDRELLPTIPLSSHEIHQLDSVNWYVKTVHGTIRFYGESLQAIPPDRYQDFLSNHYFICLLKSPKWEIWDRATLNRLSENSYDSVARLGMNIMMIMDEQGTTLLFRNGVTLKLTKKDQVRLIREANQSMGFLQVNGSGGKRQVYDLEGNPVYHTWYYDLQPLAENLFIIERNGIKGIVNLQGKILMKPRYQTIVADSTNHISLLHNGRFGYFNPIEESLIKPQYESRVTSFNQHTLLSSKKGKKGLIDHGNKVLIPFEYDEIKQWSDSSVIARKQNNWMVLNYYTGEIEFKDITGLDWISNHNNRRAIIKTKQGYGLLDNKLGMLLNPGFNDIINLGTTTEPVFFTEKYIPEADYFVVIYYNQHMDVIRKQVFDSGNYDQVYCY